MSQTQFTYVYITLTIMPCIIPVSITMLCPTAGFFSTIGLYDV